jgi:hypothetical protein
MTSTKYDTRRLSHNGQRPTVPNPRAGVTLKAVDALRDTNVQHFTREQVAYLMHLAFLSGAEHRRAHDVAELMATWDEKFPGPGRCTVVRPHTKRIRDLRKAARMAEYDRIADLKRAREAYDRPSANPWPDCEWPEVARPGSGLPEST